jgi:hypothetical protein
VDKIYVKLIKSKRNLYLKFISVFLILLLLRFLQIRILYARLEFHPDDRFSPEAKQLLEGLINRDPQLRLGAWENPPKDIMSSSFFSKIRWDAIYERRQDGPWQPDLPGFYRRSMMSNPSPKVTAEEALNESTSGKINFTPPPFERMTEEQQIQQQQQQQQQQALNAAPPASRRNTETKKNGENDEDEDEEEEEDDEAHEDSYDDDLPSQDLAMRDSVFISNQNEVPGWSFIDEDVLMSYITSLTDKKEGKTKGDKKKGKKEKKATTEENNTTHTTAEVTVEEKKSSVGTTEGTTEHETPQPSTEGNPAMPPLPPSAANAVPVPIASEPSSVGDNENK